MKRSRMLTYSPLKAIDPRRKRTKRRIRRLSNLLLMAGSALLVVSLVMATLPAPALAKGRVLTLRYDGPGTSTVEAFEGKDNTGTSLGQWTVQNGDLFVVTGRGGGEFKADTYFVVTGGYEWEGKIHTSCSRDVVGQTFGPLYVIGLEGTGKSCPPPTPTPGDDIGCPPPGKCLDCTDYKYEAPGGEWNGMCGTVPQGEVVTAVAIKAGTDCFVESVPGCYTISYSGRDWCATREGSGCTCKAISHIEVCTEPATPTPTPTNTPINTPTPTNTPTNTPTPTTTPTNTPTSTPTGTPTPGPSIDIEKSTDGEDADSPTGPSITVGDTVNWTYVVTNTGNVPLTNITVTDNQGVTVNCPADSLEPAQSMTCTASGTATAGQYANIGTTCGEYEETTVCDQDPSHYFGTVVEVLGVERAPTTGLGVPPLLVSLWLGSLGSLFTLFGGLLRRLARYY